MKLIILLVCILLQTFNIRLFQERYRPANLYINYMKPLLSRFGLDSNWGAIAGILAPALIIIAVLNLLFSHVWLLYLIYGVLILLICLDIRDVKTKLLDFFNALSTENATRAQIEVEKFTQQPADEDKSTMVRVVTGAILVQSITNIFSVIFWFLFLGPFGAVLYYLVAAMGERSVTDENAANIFYNAAKYCKDILDWIPVRLVTFTYALIGHFGPVFNVWLEHLGNGVSKNSTLLIDAGLVALDVSKDANMADVTENHQAASLVNRTLWTWVIAITLVYIIGWLF